MKKLIILSFVVLIGILIVAQGLFAQTSNKYQRQLQINNRGEIMDHGTKLGYISKEDIVFNHQDKKLGFIENGKVYDSEGNILGKARKNGRYYKNNGENVLYVSGNNEKCKVLDPKGHLMGYVHKNYKLHACAMHCFFKRGENEDGSPRILNEG